VLFACELSAPARADPAPSSFIVYARRL